MMLIDVRLALAVILLNLCCNGEDYNPSPTRGKSRNSQNLVKQRDNFQGDNTEGKSRGSTKKTRSRTQQGRGRGDDNEEESFRDGGSSTGSGRGSSRGRDKAERGFQGEERLDQGSRPKNQNGGKMVGRARDDMQPEENDQDGDVRPKATRSKASRGKVPNFDQDEDQYKNPPKADQFNQARGGNEQLESVGQGGLRGSGPSPAETVAVPVSKGAVPSAVPKGGALGTASMVDTLFQTGNQKTCGVKPIIPKPVPATWVGSFPGSGAEVTWQLIQAITGLATDEDTSNIGHAAKGNAVAIKTHFPSLAPAGAFINLQKKLGVKQAILLIRNPMSAIPSYFNFQWEHENGLKPHSRRAPPHKWVEWRNGNFENELVRWVEHVRWWADSFQVNQPGRLHLLVFERLVSPESGIDELTKLGRYLRNVSPIIAESMIPFKEYACVWEMLVQPPASSIGGRQRSDVKVLRGPRKFPYTSQQLQLLNKQLTDLKNEYARSFPDFSNLMQEYLTELETQFLFMKTD